MVGPGDCEGCQCDGLFSKLENLKLEVLEGQTNISFDLERDPHDRKGGEQVINLFLSFH